MTGPSHAKKSFKAGLLADRTIPNEVLLDFDRPTFSIRTLDTHTHASRDASGVRIDNILPLDIRFRRVGECYFEQVREGVRVVGNGI